MTNDLDGTVVRSTRLAVDLNAVCYAGLAVDEALRGEDAVLIVAMLGIAYLTSTRSRSRWKFYC